mgnify:CR=1 FL=1
MLEDFRLKVFKAVAENRSFTKAAAVLRITQPAVSQNIAELEKTVGAKLFDRLKGETVLRRCLLRSGNHFLRPEVVLIAVFACFP